MSPLFTHPEPADSADSYLNPRPLTSRTIHWVAKKGFCGLGDRLRGIAGVLTVPGVLNVHWPLNRACPFSFRSLFDYPRLVEIPKSHPKPSGAIVCKHNLNLWGRKAYLALSKVHGGTYDQFMIDFATTLREIMAVAKSADSVEEFRSCHFANRPTVGIHLRRTDAVNRKFPRSAVQALDSALWEKVMATDREAQFFLATDSKNYERVWSARLAREGRVVVSPPKKWFAKRLRQTTGEAVIKDILLLSHCERILCSTPSSLLLIATRINRSPVLEIVKAK